MDIPPISFVIELAFLQVLTVAAFLILPLSVLLVTVFLKMIDRILKRAMKRYPDER